MEVVTLQKLEKEKTEIDSFLRKIFLGRFIASISFIGYLLFLITLISGKNFVNSDFLVILIFFLFGSAMAIGFVFSELAYKRGNRNMISYALLKIAYGFKKGKIDKKYLKFLNSKFQNYDTKENVKKQNLIFEKKYLQEESFSRSMASLTFKMNFAAGKNIKNEEIARRIQNLAMCIYMQMDGVFSALKNVHALLDNEEGLPTIIDFLKKIYSFRLVKFVIFEGLAIIVLFAIYKTFYNNLDVIMSGFFLITATILGGVLISKK